MTTPPSRSRQRGASLADVAREAGVSGQTVSRVANGRENVDAHTRERVLAAMRRVGYRPNSAARALRNGQFRTLGVIMSELSSIGNMHTLEAVTAAAAAARYSITLLPVGNPSQRAVLGAFDRLDEQAVDGVIVLIEAHLLDERDVAIPDHLPVVVIDSNAAYPYPIVDTDQAMGARQATEHLLDLGHHTVWHVAGPRTSFAAERREAAWRATLAARGCPIPEVMVGDWSAGSGRVAGERLAADHRITAVFAANDQMALGVMHAMHRNGRRIPADVSVVGFDDVTEAGNFWPPLTTIRQSFHRVGQHAVEAVVTEVETGTRHSGVISVPTELIVRESSGPPNVDVNNSAG